MKLSLPAAFAFLLCLSCIGVSKPEPAEKSGFKAPGTALDSVSVHIVYDEGSYPPSDSYKIWLNNSDIPTAIAAFAPVAYKNSGGTVTLSLASDLAGFREVARNLLGTSPTVERITYEVGIETGKVAGKSVTVLFSARELLSAQGKVRTQPERHALIKAIKASGAREGVACVRSVKYSGDGTFEVEVIL